MNQKLIFIVWGSPRSSTHWCIKSAYEVEAMAQQEMARLEVSDPHYRYKVTQIPLRLKHK